ncbi:MAG TPA: RagB/SusD family nutrient uptake outer membrane protein [Chitinophagaceae bacterium]|nr:RagB/SusD family nutrient uptake outer membrane protein [Chitinophagaceae bacterium]
MKKINFKRIYILGSLIAVLSFVAFGCKQSFLVNQPIGALSNAELASYAGIEELLTGCYGALDGQTAGLGWDTPVDNWLYGSVCGGDAHKGSNLGDQADAYPIARFETLSTDSYLQNSFEVIFDAIVRCDNVLKLLPQATDITPAQASEIKGEARFLRGHYDFEAKILWNNVPYIDESIDYSKSNYHVPNTGAGALTWAEIEADFTFAMDSLPATQSLVGRANSWAAAAYLAKTYMFESKFTAAETLLDNIIANGVTSNGLPYALLPKFSDNFDAATNNGSESVFAYQATVNTSTSGAQANYGNILNWPYNGPGGCCGFFAPSQELVNSYRVDSTTGLPLLDGSWDQPSTTIPQIKAIKNDQFVPSSTQFTPDQGTVDPRLDWTVGRRGVPYLDWGPMPGSNWVRDYPTETAGPYVPIKAVFRQSEASQFSDHSSWTPGLDAINYDLIRFADVILWDAECKVENNELTAATNLVNEIRSRAANPADFVSNSQNVAYAFATVGSQAAMLALKPSANQWVVRTDLNNTWVFLGSGPASSLSSWQEYNIPHYMIGIYPTPFADQAIGRTAVRMERKLELAMEGHRFFDLVRWGVADSAMNAYFAYESTLAPTMDVTGATFKPATGGYLPLPQEEIDLSNGTLKQNPGY